jgi:hypothetical protein
MSRLSDRMLRLERADPQSLPLDVRAWLGQSLTTAEEVELAAMPDRGPYILPTDAEMTDWSPEARAWFKAR